MQSSTILETLLTCTQLPSSHFPKSVDFRSGKHDVAEVDAVDFRLSASVRFCLCHTYRGLRSRTAYESEGCAELQQHVRTQCAYILHLHIRQFLVLRYGYT